jgi:energy-coupling factor transport system permease protein
MDSRGYARVHRGSSAVVLTLMLVALVGATLGSYALLDGSSPRWLSIPMLAGGALAAFAGSAIASRRIRTTRYRPDRWGVRESLIAGSGAGVALLTIFGSPIASPGLIGWSVVFLLAAAVATIPIPVVLSS